MYYSVLGRRFLYRHTAPGSLQQWCRSEPKDCSGYDTDPGCASSGSRS